MDYARAQREDKVAPMCGIQLSGENKIGNGIASQCV